MTVANSTSVTSAAPEPGTASVPGDSGVGSGGTYFLSVGTKGLLVFVALLAYLMGASLFAMHQKKLLFQEFEKMQSTIEEETNLAQTRVSIFHVIGAITANFSEDDLDAEMRRIAMHQQLSTQLFHSRQTEVTTRFPMSASNAGDVNAAFARANKEPSLANLKLLITQLVDSESDLEHRIAQVRERRKALSAQYRAQSDAAALTVWLLGVLGLLLLGTSIGLFFRRLVADLRLLQNAALATVRGIRGKPIAVTRNDEVGQLMVAVNSMADTLDQSEKDLMLERQKYFHQEKMAAIGTLAAGIAHEIGNPIAAISGIAEQMIERRGQGLVDCGAKECGNCHPELIFEQTTRLAAITREISEFSSPAAGEPQLFDLNAQLRSTVNLIRYDKRLQNISLHLNLDSQLPAIQGLADQITQLIMNLLINAMDALVAISGRSPSIEIQTGFDARRVWVLVSDNGCGMTPATLSRAFEAFFTTKTAGKGTGLGLSLCYSIVKEHGGSVEIQSTPDVGTKVKVFFPLPAAFSAENSAV